MPFEKINKAYNSVFQENKLSLGLVVPIENYATTAYPSMQHHVSRVKLAEKLGFKSIWIRDVPFHVPGFGDTGQTYDPFTYLGFLVAQTTTIGLGVASIALPLHHPVHVAKSAATIDQLSGGRMLLGIASGDRFDEYPAMGFEHLSRGEQFRDAVEYIRKAQEPFPKLSGNRYGQLRGDIDILPKATGHKIPMLVTGYSQQSLDWNAEHGDGWMYYPRDLNQQKATIEQWRGMIPQDHNKPFMQPLYVDLMADDDFEPQPIHLGFRTGANALVEYLQLLQQVGVNHVAINLRFNQANIEDTLEELSYKVLPYFH